MLNATTKRARIILVVVFTVAAGLVSVATWRGAMQHRPSGQTPYVFTNSGVRVDLTYRAKKTADQSADNAFMYSGAAEYTFRNERQYDVRIKLPLARLVNMSPNTAEFVSDDALGGVWKENRTLELRPGETATIATPCGGTVRKTSSWFGSALPEMRHALVFDVPDDANPDRYLVGTIVTEPVRWVFTQ